ncbi:transmembrane adaptor Erv26 [Powellomyces hirtus]|nr:transmembrane adaptor Erv26 [Powellomyces hirtus]
MIILGLLTYVGAVVGFAFVTLSLACGLYYLAELVEEYTVTTKKIIKITTAVTIVVHILLWLFDGLPFKRVLFSLLCQAWYSQLLRTFPDIELSSPAFILSCILVISDHFVWFFYFTDHYHTFFEIATFFGLVVWLIPFMYFISLSANEYTLPNFGMRLTEIDCSIACHTHLSWLILTDASAGPRKKNNNLIKTIAGWLGAAKQVVLPESSAQKAF